MKNIGKYHGIPCYECTRKAYMAYKDLDDGSKIFIIDGTMVRENIIVGKYDGKHVTDLYDGRIYCLPDEKKKATFTAENSKWDEKFVEEVKTAQESRSGTTVVVPYEELVKQDFDFKKYSTIVDQFFALLER